MNLPVFNPRQTGVIILLAAALLVLYTWRADFWRAASAPPTPLQTPVFIEITGATPRPGVYSFPHPPTLLDALKTAGGAAIAVPANPTLTSGSRIEINEEGGYLLNRMAGPRLLTLGLAINLNEATQEDLEALPGLGPALAGRIIAYRNEHGRFQDIEDLEKISGIGLNKLKDLMPFMTLKD